MRDVQVQLEKVEETAEQRRERFLNIIDAHNYKKRKEHSNTYNVGFLTSVLTTVLTRYVDDSEAERLLNAYFIEEGW